MADALPNSVRERSMILTLAFRNLFHDRIRLAVTLVGILFSIVLVAVQLGLYLGASKMITTSITRKPICGSPSTAPRASRTVACC
jgi:hypothetical protein